MSVAIQFENISKQYRLGMIGTGTISHDLKRWWAVNMRGKEDPYLKIGSVNERSSAADSDYIWALRDINFEVQQGEVLGIIGKNGAGKSTLLKLLSRVTSPTTGAIRAKGRIASLLEVGTGFHPEMTGRENIFMNGAIMGMTKAEIRSKLDEIIDFSGVERYIDTPVKRYSSGMMVRLGFAVAAHLEPEILVVDEVLAVGDAEFQKKAIGKMQDVAKGEGRTVLFVSHNMASVSKLCTKGILLENGGIKRRGDINDIIIHYMEHQTIKDQTYFPQNNVVKEIEVFQKLNKLYLRLRYESSRLIKQPNLGFRFSDMNSNIIFGTNAIQNMVDNFGEPKKKGEVIVEISSPILINGVYHISVWFNDGIAHDKHLFAKENCISIIVSEMSTRFINKIAKQGFVFPECNWNFI